ncbi:MAG: hypothetical protein OEP52_02590 [Acidimicrobiia bacterium]|nr:hypothetical protein [Acidimicrobiia bacterium]
MRSTTKRLATVVMAMAMVMAVPGVASAHHPEITATPDCMLADGSWYLSYTASAWTTGTTDDASRTNTDVRIYVNDVEMDSGEFNVANGFTFGNTLLVPSGIASATVKAVAVVRWGADQTLGALNTYRETTVGRPTTLCVSNPGTGTPGYWHKMGHWEDWDLTGVTVGGEYYSAQEAIDLIRMPVKGDKTLTMFPALVAAVLNVQIGNEDECIAGTIAAAHIWMVENPLGSGVKARSDAWDDGEPLYWMLDRYNNGLLCAPDRG